MDCPKCGTELQQGLGGPEGSYSCPHLCVAGVFPVTAESDDPPEEPEEEAPPKEEPVVTEPGPAAAPMELVSLDGVVAEKMEMFHTAVPDHVAGPGLPPQKLTADEARAALAEEAAAIAKGAVHDVSVAERGKMNSR